MYVMVLYIDVFPSLCLADMSGQIDALRLSMCIGVGGGGVGRHVIELVSMSS